jgi:hypothetical protein
LVAVTVTGPTDVGVMVNVCGADELLNDLTIAAEGPPFAPGELPDLLTIAAVAPPPETVIVMLPVNAELGVMVKIPDWLLINPPVGPVSVYPVCGIVTWFEGLEAALIPAELVAVTEHV